MDLQQSKNSRIEKASWKTNKVKKGMVKPDKFFQRCLYNPTDENKEKFKTIRNNVTKDNKISKREHPFEALGTNNTMKTTCRILKALKLMDQPMQSTVSADTSNDYFAEIGPVSSAQHDNRKFKTHMTKSNASKIYG